MSVPVVRLLTLNVNAPGAGRAIKLFDWLVKRPEDVFVLTDVRLVAGGSPLTGLFSAAGFGVTVTTAEQGGRGVLIASRVGTSADPMTNASILMPERAAGVRVHTERGPIRVIGAYVPTYSGSHRGAAAQRKQRWLDEFTATLAASTMADPSQVVLLGDLNVIEPNHQPACHDFAAFSYDFYQELTSRCGLVDAYRQLHPDTVEHSWPSTRANGQDNSRRLDHAFCSAALAGQVIACDYIHQTRRTYLGLSDHSALTLAIT